MIVLNFVEPVFLHFLIKLFQRSFQVSLDKIEEDLLLFSFKEESDGVGVAQRTSCSHYKASNVDQELIFVWRIKFIQF